MPEPAAGTCWCRVFPGRESELRSLRRWLTALLPDGLSRDDVICVASELGTNAVRHTASGQDGFFAVEITWLASAVRIAVADRGARVAPRVIDDPDGENGRGLLLVAGLAARSGVCGDERGRLVWADIPLDTAGPEALPEPDDHTLAAAAAKLDAVLRRVRLPADLWPGLAVSQVTPDPAEVG